MESQLLRAGINKLFPDGQHRPPAAQLRRAIALWLLDNPHPETGTYEALLTDLSNYVRQSQLRELWRAGAVAELWPSLRVFLEDQASRSVFIVQETNRVLRKSSVRLNEPLLLSPPPHSAVPEQPPCHPTFSTLTKLRSAIHKAFNSRKTDDGRYEDPDAALSRVIGHWLSNCPCAETLPDRPFTALLSDVDAWLHSGGNPGSELWSDPAYSWPPLRDFLTAPERGGCFRVVAREGHIGNDLVQLDLEAVRAKAAAVTAAEAAAAAAATARNRNDGSRATTGAAAGAGASAGSARGQAPVAPAAVPAAVPAPAASWGVSSARPSRARQLVEAAYPLHAAADGDSWRAPYDGLRRAIALGLADRPEPQQASGSWLRDFIKKRELQPLWQQVSGSYPDVCDFLVAPDSRGVFRVQGLPQYPDGLVSLDTAALERLVAEAAQQQTLTPQLQPHPASQPAPQLPPQLQPTAQHPKEQLQQQAQSAAVAAPSHASGSSAVALTAPSPSSGAAAARMYRPVEIVLAVAAAWPGDAPQCVLRRQAAAELAAAGPCAGAGGLGHALDMAEIAELLHSTQHAAATQLRSEMGGRMDWAVLLTSNGGGEFLSPEEAKAAITPLEAVATAGDRYSRHLLRLVHIGEVDIAVLLNVPELMRRYGSSSSGSSTGGEAGGSSGPQTASRFARTAGEHASWRQQQPTTPMAPAIVAGRAGRLPDMRMAAAAGGGSSSNSGMMGAGFNSSRLGALAQGGQPGLGGDAGRWWHQPASAGVATPPGRLPPQADPDGPLEAALGSLFREPAAAEADAEALRCVARLLLQAPPPHILGFSYLGQQVVQLMGRPCVGLRHQCSQWPDVFRIELEGVVAVRVQLVCDRLLRLLAPPRRGAQPSPTRTAPESQQPPRGGAESGAHVSRSAAPGRASAVPAVRSGAGGAAHAAPELCTGLAAPVATTAQPPAQPRAISAVAPRAAAADAAQPTAAGVPSLDRSTAAELIREAFPLRDDGGEGRWRVPAPDQAALQVRQAVALWLASSPERRKLGPWRAALTALNKHLVEEHAGLWQNPAHGFPKLWKFLQSPDSLAVFIVHAGQPGDPSRVVELDTAALLRAAPVSAARWQQHQTTGLAAGAAGAAEEEERGRRSRSGMAGAASGGSGAAGTAHRRGEGSDFGNGGRSQSRNRRSPSPKGAYDSGAAAVALDSEAAGRRAGGVAAGAGAATAMGTTVTLDESTAALIRAAFPLRLAGDEPAPGQPARKLRQAIATWLAGSPFASELGPRRATMNQLGKYLKQEQAALWRNRAHGFPKLTPFLQSPDSRGVFFVHERQPGVLQLVELDVLALARAAGSAVAGAAAGPVVEAAGQQGGGGAAGAVCGMRQEPAAAAGAVAGVAASDARIPSSSTGNGREGPAAAPAVPARVEQQQPQQQHTSPAVVGSTPAWLEMELGQGQGPQKPAVSVVQPALPVAAETAAASGAATGGDRSRQQLLVPVPQPEGGPNGAVATAAAPTAEGTQLLSPPFPDLVGSEGPRAAASAGSAGAADGLLVWAGADGAMAGGLEAATAAADAAMGFTHPQDAAAVAAAPAAAGDYAQQPQAHAEPMLADATAASLAAPDPDAVAAVMQLPDAALVLVADPKGESHTAMLQHCGHCSTLGVAVQVHGGKPTLVSLYAPSALMQLDAYWIWNWPAAVYLVDPLAAAAAYGGGTDGDAAAAKLLHSLRELLEAPSITKMVYDGFGALSCLEEAIAACSGDTVDVVHTYPIQNLRLVVKSVEMMLDLPHQPPPPPPSQPNVPHNGVGSYLPGAGYASRGVALLRGLHTHVARLRDALTGTGLWADRPQLLAALTARHFAALREDAQAALGASGSDDEGAARLLTRPLGPSQVELAARASRHLPELWAALVQEAVPWVAAHASMMDMAAHRQQAL